MRTPMNAQVASGQVMPISVKTPMIALSKGDFKARSKYRSSVYENYVIRMGEEGLYPFYEKLGEERMSGLLSKDSPQIFTAINGLAKIKKDKLPTTVYEEDSSTSSIPDYRVGNKGLEKF